MPGRAAAPRRRSASASRCSRPGGTPSSASWSSMPCQSTFWPSLSLRRRELEMAAPAERHVREHREGREVGEIERDLAVGRLGRRQEAAAALHVGQRRRGVENVDRKLAVWRSRPSLAEIVTGPGGGALLAQHRQRDVLRAALERRRDLRLGRESRRPSPAHRACRLRHCTPPARSLNGPTSPA